MNSTVANVEVDVQCFENMSTSLILIVLNALFDANADLLVDDQDIPSRDELVIAKHLDQRFPLIVQRNHASVSQLVDSRNRKRCAAELEVERATAGNHPRVRALAGSKRG
jgi:hypothetical protein